MGKKKNAKSQESKPPRQVDATIHVPQVALLIDGENVNTPTLITNILAEAGKMGGVTVRQIYGHWSAASMQPWKKQLEHYEIEAMGNRPGPNATDIALTIGAMDLLYRGYKHFCLVTGDSDYVPLIHRLHQDGCTVLVIGATASSNALKKVCSRFLSTDQLVANVSLDSKQPANAKMSSPFSPSQITDLSVLLMQAYRTISPNGNEWIHLSDLGNTLQKDATFVRLYGKKKLSTLLKECSELFETRKKKTNKGGETDVVRSR